MCHQHENSFVNIISSIVVLVSVGLSGVYSDQNETSISKPFKPGVKRQPGVYIEKWSGIDQFEIRRLLEDSRFPYMPTWSGYSTAFQQPSNWGENYGSRIRTYFSPQDSGKHVFFIASFGESQLFLSDNRFPEHKSMIATVSGMHYTDPMQYDKYDEQKSWPVALENGSYYYLESLMKAMYARDHLSVAVQTPDGKMYSPIPSQFLWTAPPLPLAQNETAQKILLSIAAKAGAQAGANAGMQYAMESGQRAGNAAGYLAGRLAGAEAGAMAAAQAAKTEVIRTINEALQRLSHRRQGLSINLLKPDGTVLSRINSIPIDGGGALPSKLNLKELSFRPVETNAQVNSQRNTTESTSNGTNSSSAATGGASKGATAQALGASSVAAGSASSSSSSSSSSSASLTSSSSSSSSSLSVVNTKAVFSSANTNEVLSAESSFATSEFSAFVYEPKPGEAADVMARELVYDVGPASKLVIGGYYSIHSLDSPANQVNASLNYCFRSIENRISVRPGCHYFIVRKGFVQHPGSRIPVSFESACKPGYFITQKNFHIMLKERDGTQVFDRESTFTMYKSTTYPSALQITSTRQYWLICEADKKHRRYREIFLDFPALNTDYLTPCSFVFKPLGHGDNALQNCRDVVLPEGLHQPGHHHSAPHTPVGNREQTCVALNFVNEAGIPFYISTNLKHEKYYVSGDSLRLKTIIRRPELHRHVMFSAVDPTSKNVLFLEGDRSISVKPKPSCGRYTDIVVTTRPDDVNVVTTQKFPIPKEPPPVQYHYHYHPEPFTQPECPSSCSSYPVCPVACPGSCCKRNLPVDQPASAKSIISAIEADRCDCANRCAKRGFLLREICLKICEKICSH